MSLRVGSVTPRFVASLSLTPASVGTSAIAAQTFTVPGLQTDMCVVVNAMATEQASLALVHARVSALNTLSLTWANTAAAPVVPTAGEFRVVAF